MKYSYLLFILSIVLLGCSKRKGIEESSSFVFPESLSKMEFGLQDSASNISKMNSKKVIVLINAGCSLCHTEIWQWERFISKHDSFKNLPIIFIIYGRTFNTSERLMKNSRLKDFIFLRDPSSETLSANNLKQDKFFNAFLLGDNNKILCPGNPTLSDKILNNYLAILK